MKTTNKSTIIKVNNEKIELSSEDKIALLTQQNEEFRAKNGLP